MSNTKKFILGFNWKMNPATPPEALELAKSYKVLDRLVVSGELECYVFLPDIYFGEVSGELSKHLRLGSQDVSGQETGAQTGQISAQMLLASGGQAVLVGHSETRAYKKYTQLEVFQKLKQSLETGLKTFWCLGYYPRKSKTGLAADRQLIEGLREELQEGLKFVQKNLGDSAKGSILKNLVLAYEPMSAIGSGQAASFDHINAITAELKNILKNFDFVDVPVLYGGSISSNNFESMIKETSVNGFLIGGASLKPLEIQAFVDILSPAAG